MLLVPDGKVRKPHDPYDYAGARSLARIYREDVLDMLNYMMTQRELYTHGKTFLAQSPLKSKLWVAAAMKTLGLMVEHESPNGACVLTLTDKALRQIEPLRKYL